MSRNSSRELRDFEINYANAVIGVDTLWGGDVMNPSGPKRAVADTWFSDAPLPEAYYDLIARRMRRLGGVGTRNPAVPDLARRYARKFALPDRIKQIRRDAERMEPYRREVVNGLADALQVQLNFALSQVGQAPVPSYEAIVHACTGTESHLIDLRPHQKKLVGLLERARYQVERDEPWKAIAKWKADNAVSARMIKEESPRIVAELDKRVQKSIVPALPSDMQLVPRTNVEFREISGVSSIGFNNYLGRQRVEGRPVFEGTYEVNTGATFAKHELKILLAHEVTPGHHMVNATNHHQFWRGKSGFESTIDVMNSRRYAFVEGIAGSSFSLLYSEKEIESLPLGEQIALAFNTLLYAGYNNVSFLYWAAGKTEQECAEYYMKEVFATREGADRMVEYLQNKLKSAMYLPKYDAGTSKFREWIVEYGRKKVIPVAYGAHGFMDIITADWKLKELYGARA